MGVLFINLQKEKKTRHDMRNRYQDENKDIYSNFTFFFFFFRLF